MAKTATTRKAAAPKDLVANPGACEEASTLSRERYIPCNAPATMLVKHRGRAEGPYRMCEECGTHNIQNRNAEMVKRLKPAPGAALAPPKPQNAALAKLSENFSIELAPFPQGEALAAFHGKASALVVIATREAHQTALELLREGKALNRGVEEHWRKVLRWLEDRKKDVRAIMDTDAAMAEPHITRLSRLCVSYEETERARVRLEEERQRAEQQRIANEQREREQAEMERLALAAEGQSENLSDRERAFAQQVYMGVEPVTAAKLAGFKDPATHAARLMKVGKVTAAIDGMREAQALRDQAKAAAAKPVEIKKVEVESNLGRVSGTRTVTTWTAECTDYRTFVAAFQHGEVDFETFCDMTQPSETGGNQKARAMHENLDRIPGWRHIKKETKAA